MITVETFQVCLVPHLTKYVYRLLVEIIDSFLRLFYSVKSAICSWLISSHLLRFIFVYSSVSTIFVFFFYHRCSCNDFQLNTLILFLQSLKRWSRMFWLLLSHKRLSSSCIVFARNMDASGIMKREVEERRGRVVLLSVLLPIAPVLYYRWKYSALHFYAWYCYITIAFASSKFIDDYASGTYY